MKHAYLVMLIASVMCSHGCGDNGSGDAVIEGARSIEDLQFVFDKNADVLRVAYGSCADDDAPNHPVWGALESVNADLVLMLGDNVYADSPEFKDAPSKQLMQAEYAKLSASPGFARLRASTPMFATWDDHDFGRNDGGASFAFKTQAAEIFKEFWEYPTDDPARARAGVYAERRVRHAGLDVQVILLDTRSFRGALTDAGRSLSCPLKNYELNTTGTFLGEEQWRWLESQLGKPADFRILVSSQQVIADQHCFEKWGNFPNERLRLFDVIRRSGATNLVVLSGDRHLGEISRLPADYPGGTGFDLYEVTSSPLSARSGFGWGETNDYRVNDDNLRESQFGVLDIYPVRAAANGPDADDTQAMVTGLAVGMHLLDAEGQVRFSAHERFTVPTRRNR